MKLISTSRLSLVMAMLLLLLGTNYSTFAAPVTAAKNMTFTSIDGDRVTVSWTNGSGSKRVMVARKGAPVTALPQFGVTYAANAGFGLGAPLSSEEFVVYNSNGSSVTVTRLLPGQTYYFAVFEYDGSDFTTDYLTVNPATGSVTTLVAPTVQASVISFSNVTGNSMKLNWAKGNGAKRLLLAKKNAPVNANPADLTDYTSSSFGLGSEIGSGNYVVYSGAADNTTLNSLEAGTTYHFALFEYNGSSGPVYLTASPAIASNGTAPRPTLNATNLSFNSINGTTLSTTFTAGNGSRRIVVARAGQPVDAMPVDGTIYTAKSVFGTGDSTAPGQYVVYNNSSASFSVTGLQPATVYYFAVFEYDLTGTAPQYLTTGFLNNSKSTSTTPLVSASNISFSNITNYQATISWQKGDGDKRLVVIREGAPVDTVPVDLTSYNTHQNYGTYKFGQHNYAIYDGSAASTTVYNLQPSKTYYVSIFEMNGTNAPMYKITNAPVANFTTAIKPTIAAKSMSFAYIEGNSMQGNFTAGNGVKRLVIARAGSPVTAMPADGIDYPANSVFGSGTSLGSGQYAIYNNSGAQFNVTGLSPNTVYYFAVFEYSIGGSSNFYLTSTYLDTSKKTLEAPTVPSSNIVVSNITSNSAKLTWTSGDGVRRIVIAKKDVPVNFVVSDLTAYNYNGYFGSALAGYGNYVVYNGSGNSVVVSSLVPNTTYHFQVVEMNGFSGPVYLQAGAPTASATMLPQPTQPATSTAFSYVEGNSMRIAWTNGNGTRRIIIARKNAPVTAVPQNGYDYSANSNFGSGSQLAPGEYVVYDGSGTYADIKNLTPSTRYYYSIVEYDGSGSNIGYLSANPTPADSSTMTVPTVQTNNFIFSNITTNTVNVGWTNGNGASRILIGRKNQPVTATPSDFTSYVSNASFGTSSAAIGTTDQFVLYKGNASNTNITNLSSGTTYYFAAFELNGSSAPVYMQTNPLTGLVTTAGPPSTQASNVEFANPQNNSILVKWTKGSGQKRIVLAREGNAPDFVPVNNTTYTANSFFGSGQLVGTDNYVVYTGTDDNVTVTNLSPNKVYYFSVFDFNDFSTGPAYITLNPATGSVDMSVIPPVIVNAPTDTATYSGRNVKFSVGATGPSVIYQWQMNNGNGWQDVTNTGCYSNATKSTLTVTNVLSNMSGTQYRCVLVNNGGTATTTAVGLTIKPHTWLGANTSWTSIANWDAGTVPSSDANVVIPNTTSKPNVTSGTISCKNLTVNNGATLTLNGATLQLTGSIQNNGTITATNGTIVLNGNAPQSIPGNTFANNTVANLNADNATSVSLDGVLNITGTLYVNAGTLNTNDYLVLKSSATSTAMVAPVSGTINGNVVVERYNMARRAWKLMTAPVKNTGSVWANWQMGGEYIPGYGLFVTGPNADTAINGLDRTSGSSLSTYNANTNTWQAVTNTKAANLSHGTASIPYLVFVRGDRNVANLTAPNKSNTIVRSVGALQTGNQYVTTTAGNSKFTLVGNPYASPLDFDKVYNTNAGTGIERKFWAWDPNLSGVGGYVTVSWNGVSYDVVPTSNQTVNIQSGQAFFIQNSASAAGASVLEIQEAHKSSVNTNSLFRQGNQLERLAINLHLVNSDGSLTLSDGVLANFHNNFNTTVGSEDAAKLMNFEENMSLKRDGHFLSIEGRPLIDDGDTLFLNFSNMKQRNYKLKLEASNFNAPGLTAHIHDVYFNTNTPVSLTGNTNFDFAIGTDAGSTSPDRFMIVLKTASTLPVHFTQVTARQKENAVQVEWKVSAEENINSYEIERSANGVSFNKIGSVSASGNKAYSVPDATPAIGFNYYRIKVIERDNSFGYSNVESVKWGETKGDIAIYPNPVKGNVVNLQFLNMESGVYAFELVNVTGQKVQAGQINYDGVQLSQHIQLVGALPSGQYQLVIFNGKSRIMRQLLVE